MSCLSGKQPVSHIVAIRIAMVAAFIFVSSVTLWSDETIGDSLPSSLTTNRSQDYTSAQSGLIDQLMASDSALSMPQSRDVNIPRQTIANQMRTAMRPATSDGDVVSRTTGAYSSSLGSNSSSLDAYRSSLGSYGSNEQIVDQPEDPALQNVRYEPSFIELENHQRSFIEREKAKPSNAAEGSELVKRLGINLIFVLLLAGGGLLLVKQWQGSRKGRRPFAKQGSRESNKINVTQVQTLVGGASLHVVEVIGNQFLIAVDSSGIRSVNPLVQDFGQTLGEPEDFVDRADDAESRFDRRDEPATEVDENLIRLLLNSHKRAG